MRLPSCPHPPLISSMRKADQAIAQFTDFVADITTFLWHSDLHPPSSWDRIQFRTYCRHIISSTRVSASVVILALKYISRLRYRRNYHQPRPGTEFQIFAVALFLANKFLEDQSLTIQYWSQQSSISVAQLNLLEIEMLKGTNYSLYVSQEEYSQWLKRLELFISMRHTHYLIYSAQISAISPATSEDFNPYTPQVQIPNGLYTAEANSIIS